MSNQMKYGKSRFTESRLLRFQLIKLMEDSIKRKEKYTHKDYFLI